MPSQVRHEVWAKALWVALDIAEHGGVAMAPLFEGLPFDEKGARRLRRVAWDDYCTVGDRIEDAVGGSDALADLCENAFPEVTPELRMIAGSVVSAKTLLRLFSQIFNPLVFPPLEFVYEDRGENLVHLEIWQRPGARRCRSFDSASLGVMRGMPRHLDLPPAQVTGTLAEDHMSWTVVLPPSRTLAKRARQASSAVITRIFNRLVLGYDDDGAPIGAGAAPPAAVGVDERVAQAARRWSLTRRQVEVLEILVRGKSNKDIALALACAENTVELHVTQLLRRTSAASRAELIARFWSESSVDA